MTIELELLEVVKTISFSLWVLVFIASVFLGFAIGKLIVGER